MRRRLGYLLAACSLTLLLSACSSNDEDTGELPNLGGVRALNAFPDLETVTFRVVFEDFDPSVFTRLAFQAPSTLVDFSERQYTFNFEVVLPDAEDPTILAETTGTVLPDTLYDYVLAGDLDNPQLFLWTQPRRDWLQVLTDAADNGTEITELDVAFGHAAASVGAVDVYLEAPGTDPAAATPRGSIAFGQLAPQITVEEGTYQLTVTAQGDPATVLFTSGELELLAANTALYAVVEDGGRTTQEVTVQQVVSSVGVALGDVNSPAAISVIHAAPDASAIDVYDNADFDTPLISGLAFGELSDDVEVPFGETTFATTPAGDVSVVLTETLIDLQARLYNRIYVAGLPGDLQAFVANDDRRAFVTQGRLRAFNGSVQFDVVDLYLLEPGVALEDSPVAISSLPFGTASVLATINPGEFDIVLTEEDTTNIIFGPQRLTVEGGNVFELIITDDAQMTQADVTVLETAAE